MRVVALRQLLILLTSLAFLFGSGAQVMSAARSMALTPATAGHAVMGEDCATMTEHGNAVHAPMKQGPCKRISYACATQCICPSALPAAPAALASPVGWRVTSYWPRRAAALAELSIEPDFRPPIAA
jgi:hypothetical protein